MARSRFFLPFLLAFSSMGGRAFAQVKAAPVKFNTMMIGETGAPPQIGAGAGDAMETISRQQGGDGTFGRDPRQGRPEVKKPPTAVTPAVIENGPSDKPVPAGEDSVSLPPSFLPAANPLPRRQEEKAAPSRQEKDRRKYSLWEGLAAPLELPGSKIKDASPDSALALGRKDYDAHILGSLSAEAKPVPNHLITGPGRPDPLPKSPDVASGPQPRSMGGAARSNVEDAGADQAASRPVARPHEVFVTVNLDLRSSPGQLKDAVAALQKAVDFRPDPRFAARVEGPAQDKASIWGWLAADKVGAAMQAPAVTRLEIGGGVPRQDPQGQGGRVSEMLVGLRVRAEAPADVLARVLPELAADAGFVWRRTVGTQQAPGSKATVVIVAGVVPLKNLARVLSHPDVVKMVSSPDAGGARPEVSAPGAPDKGFFSFALGRYPALILLSLAMVFMTVGPGFSRFVEIFIPYRR